MLSKAIMKRPILVIVFSLAVHNLQAQSWDIDIATGFNLTRLIPVNNSTKQTAHIRYSFIGPDPYISPEICININDHSKFSFGYQYSANTTGVRFKAGGSSDIDYEDFDLHSFNIGYYSSRVVLHERAVVGWFGKAGLAYGYSTGGGGGSNQNSFTGGGPVTSAESSQKLTGFEVMPAFWMPSTTLGFTIGPMFQNPKFADRLTFTMSATVGLKNIYAAYSKVKYVVIDLQSLEEGTVQYQGMPLVLQFGLNYRLHRFGNSNN